MGSEKIIPVAQTQLLKDVANPFKKKEAVDFNFDQITYNVRCYHLKQPFIENKKILHGVSGTFKSGTLTAIMGPSGAGKSTLLNVISGYRTTGSTGRVYLNGTERTSGNVKSFLQMSCYIHQDTSLREKLTVRESMMIAAELKLGRMASRKEKQLQVHQLLVMLGLDQNVNTLSGNLSGGQKKRLSIAYELITNPPILFLDEPTTGLDSNSCSQCISILQMLARQGRTVVATIHQPSALLFEKIDNVYCLAEGRCIYNGPTKSVVPYFAEKELFCPVYHNPADFLVEVAVGEYGPVLGKLVIGSKDTIEEKEKSSEEFNLAKLSLEVLKKGIKSRTFKSEKHSTLSVRQPNGFFAEFYYLYTRNLITMQRSLRYRVTTFLAHLLCSIMIGFTFYGAGNNAEMVRENLGFVFASLIFLLYIGLMNVSVRLPTEMKSVKVEYFNQWFSLPAFFLAFLSLEIPMQTINILVAFPPMYFLSNQPLELFRGFFFFTFLLLTSLTAQSFGVMLGIVLPVKIGVFVGPVLSCLLSVFGFTLRFCDTPAIFQLLALGSYIRASFQSIAFSTYSFNRAPLECPEGNYCHFRTAEKILAEMDMTYINIYANLSYMICLTILAHTATFMYLNRKLVKR